MSVKRIYYVKHAHQTYAKTSGGERIPIKNKDGTPKMGRGGRPMTRRAQANDTSRPLPLKVCGRCRKTIQVGDPYLYWEPYFRSSTISVRCMDPKCFPRPSERESSLMSEVLAAQESVEDALSDVSGAEDAAFFEELRDQVVEALDSVIDQYREADEAFGGTGSSQSGERAEELESSKDEIENVSFDEPPERDDLDACDMAGAEDGHDEGNTEGCEDCDQVYSEAMDTWRDEQTGNLQDALGNIG